MTEFLDEAYAGGYIISDADDEEYCSNEFVYTGDMSACDYERLQRACKRDRAQRAVRKVAMWTSYTMAVLCFLGAAISCGDSDYPMRVIMPVMAAFLACMAGFYELGERLRR